MKKSVRCVLAVLVALILLSASLPVAAQTFSTKEFNGETYLDITDRDDLDAAVAQAISQKLEQMGVFFREEERNWDDTYSNNVVNYTGYHSKGVFTYEEYATSTVCVSVQNMVEENGIRECFGYVEISYIDTADQLRQADAKMDAKLAELASYSQRDKMLAIADYICSLTSYGSQELPGGGYDDINGVYDVLYGIHTNTVCTTYALTFQRFMERAGIDCFLVSNVGHAWNMVKLDGEWYGVDCTADAGSTIDRSHFLMGRSTMRQYSTAQLDPLSIFGKSYPIAANDYQAADSKPPITTGRATTTADNTTTAATAAPLSSATDSHTEETLPLRTSTVPLGEQQVVMTHEETGVKIGAKEGALPPDTTLVVELSDYVLEDAAGKFIAFDISLENGGGAIQPDGKVQVSIPIPDDYDKERLAVYHIAEDGTKAEVPFSVSGDAVTFETDHFSLYVVAETADTQMTGGHTVLWIVLCVVLIAAAGGGLVLWWFKLRRKTLADQGCSSK